MKEITDKGALAPADVVLLKSLDLAKLALFEQARDLSRDLLKKWLVDYKFKDWKVHRTTNPGKPVKPEEREARAEEIAVALGNHKLWRSHGRNLDAKKLKDLRIKIGDYSDIADLQNPIRGYSDLLTEIVDRMGISFFLHNHRLGLQ